MSDVMAFAREIAALGSRMPDAVLVHPDVFNAIREDLLSFNPIFWIAEVSDVLARLGDLMRKPHCRHTDCAASPALALACIEAKRAMRAARRAA